MNNMYNKEYTLSYYSLIDEMKKKKSKSISKNLCQWCYIMF